MARKHHHQKSRFSLSDTIKNIIMLVPNIINILSNVIALVNLETRIAGKTIVAILTLAVIYATLLTATWLSLLAILVVYLVSLQWSLLVSLLIALALNIVCLLVIGLILLRMKKNLFFPATVSECRNLREIVDDEI
ncbi:MAG: hypothetical protein ACD_45C00623G0003 [uncultured bacterium]|nr:MAG: hypothetical protein ACD_45C00623G0003 [uncultured bacterium]